MKKIEITLAILFFTGLIGQALAIPYSDRVIGISLNILVVIYFFFSIPLFLNISLKRIFNKVYYKDLSSPRVAGLIGIGYSFSTLGIGIMFKALNMHGAGIMLGLGIVSTLIISLIAGFKLINTKGDSFYASIVIRSLLFLVTGIIFHLT